MANANLLQIVRQVNYELNKVVRGKKGGKLRALLDVYEHEFSTSVDLVSEQVDRELKTKLKLDNVSSIPEVHEAIKKYVAKVYKNATTQNKKVVDVTLAPGSTPEKFTAIITPKVNEGKTNVFQATNRLRAKPLKELATELEPILSNFTKSKKTLKNALFGTEKKQMIRGNEVTYRSGGLLQLGHAEGYSVAEKSIFRWAAEEKFGKYTSYTEKLDPILFDVAYKVNTAKANRLKHLEFEVDINRAKLFDESATLNMKKGSQEEALFLKEIRAAVSQAMKVILNKRGTDEWLDFKSSSSGRQVLEGNLIPDNLGGLKPKKKLPKKVKPSDYSKDASLALNLERQVKKSSQKDSLKASGNVPKQREEPRQVTNWLSLLPLLNSRLTPRIIANMRYPSLVNRTGTFANSAKIINVEQTREGFPTFVFDYERDPYDVFDRTLGRSPWNTPERDPRALVDKSVRELVREMAISRFYTRRA